MAGKRIGFDGPHPADGSVGVLTDLSFFTGPGGPFPDNGEACFGTQPPPIPLHAANVREKRGRAESSFWFVASTFDGNHTPVYLLHMFGTFDGPWPPLDVTSMNVTDWTLHLSNEGERIQLPEV